MATTRLALEIIAKNKAKGELAGFQRSLGATQRTLQRFSSAALGMVGIASVGFALKSVTSAAIQQEQAIADLTAAMRNNSDQSNVTVTDMTKFAAAMQKVTIYGDEQIISQMAYAQNLGVTTDKLKDATTAAIGLAAKYRLDLQAAMMLVGRASQGQTQMLTRYGIVLKEGLTDQQKFAEVLRIGAESFSLAEDAAKTSGGQLAQFKNVVGDLKEEIGKGLLPTLLDVVKALNQAITLLPKVEKGYVKALDRAFPTRRVAPIHWEGPTAPPPGSALPRVVTAEEIMGRSDYQDFTANQEGWFRYEEALRTMEKFKLLAMDVHEQETRAAAAAQAAADAMARKWESVAVTMEYSLTGALDRMMWEAESWQDAMVALLRDVAREMIRVYLVQQMVGGIMGAFSGGGRSVGAVSPVSGGADYANLPGIYESADIIGSRQAGGSIDRTGLYQLHAGEFVQPAGGMNITLRNESGIPLRAQEPEVSGRDMVIGLVIADYEQGGPMRDLMDNRRG